MVRKPSLISLLETPWRVIHAVVWDSVVSTFFKLAPLPKLLPSNGVPVFVMLPLDVALPSPEILLDRLHEYLKQLVDIGVHGVMVDVWWGVCEPEPECYDFSMYIPLAQKCRSLGLKLQVVMSFHACGGNIGDSVNIPLPSWVVSAGDERDFWFKDREGNINREYISFGADHEAVLPSAEVTEDDSPQLRTPIMAYHSFMQSFVNMMDSEGLFGDPITELEIGLGPCGELRYPSYPLSRWKFPGIGEFQCFDRYLIADLNAAVAQSGSDDVKAGTFPPEDTGNYNDKPWFVDFFCRENRSPAGKFFMDWYSARILKHGEDVLNEARRVVPLEGGAAKLAVKISGVHWWKFDASRPAEATSGYIGSKNKPIYSDICKLLKSKDIILNFTCLEMRTMDQPMKARCGPRQLVNEVFGRAHEEDVVVAGENALQDFSRKAFDQIASALKGTQARKGGFTLLRLCDDLMERDNFVRFERFVGRLRKIPVGNSTHAPPRQS